MTSSLNLVFLSHTARTGVFRVGSHHLARELTRRGHEVAHVSHPVTIAHVGRLADSDVRARLVGAMRGPAVASDGVVDVAAWSPLPLTALGSGYLSKANRRLCGRALARAIRAADIPHVDVAIVDQPLFEGVVGTLRPHIIVYRPTDAHPREPLAGAERRLLRQVDGVVATSSVVLDSLSPLPDQLPTMVLENGVEFQRFARRGLAPGRDAVYVGAIDARFDWFAVIDMARAAPSITFRLAGPVRSQPPNLPTNIRLLGPVPYRDIPALLQSAAVGLLPLSTAAANAGRSPMKYYEYLAAGLWVVASRSPTLAQRTGPGIALYATAAEATDRLIWAISQASRNEAGVDHARQFDWGARSELLLAFISSLPR